VLKNSVFFNFSDEDTAGSELQASAQLDYGQGNIFIPFSISLHSTVQILSVMAR